MHYSDINYLELEQSRGFSDHICDLANEFMGAFNLSHIWVSKDYFDGRYYHLTNDLTWKEDQVTNNHYRDFASSHYTTLKGDTQKSQFFMWQSQPSVREDLMDKAFRYGLHSGFNMIVMKEDHLENYGFGSPKGMAEIINNLPAQADLEMFCLYLRENIFKADLLRNPIMGNTGYAFKPSQPMKGYFNSPIPELFSFECNKHEEKLTRQEVICLALLARGYGQKDSARIMNLSPRTIEFHLIQVKTKFNNPSKLELITKFHDSPLSNVDPLLLLERG